MSLTLVELKVESDKIYKDLTLQDWKDKSDYRGITKRSQKDFDNLIPMYVKKIDNIREQLRGDWSAILTPIVNDKLKTPLELGNELTEQLQYLLEKETRLIDKFATCVKEVEIRKDGDVIRTDLHDQAVYYIDYGQADDTGDGLTTGNAYKTITKYTTTEIRTAGDVAYLRANVTWLQGTQAVDIIFDEDGTIDDYIKIIGCDSVTNDPWNDDSDVKPIIDFEDASYQFLMNGDHYWYFERLDVRQGTDIFGMFRVYQSFEAYFQACDFSDSVDIYLVRVDLSASAHFNSCTFKDSGIMGNMYMSSSYVTLNNCTLDGGAVRGSQSGISINGATCDILNSSLGETVNFTLACIYTSEGGAAEVRLRNCTYAGTFSYGASLYPGISVHSEDHDGTFESHISQFFTGTIIRGTTSPRAGGADSFAIMTPSAKCGPNNPFILGDRLSGFARIWATKNVQINLSVYARVDSAWDSALTVAECYAKFSYLNNAASAARTEVDSTEQITNDAAWTELTSGNFTPLQTGWVYVWLYLEEYEDATEKVDVDLKVT